MIDFRFLLNARKIRVASVQANPINLSTVIRDVKLWEIYCVV